VTDLNIEKAILSNFT